MVKYWVLLLFVCAGCEGTTAVYDPTPASPEVELTSQTHETFVGTFVIDDVETELVYQVVDGLMIVDGDMIIGTVEGSEGVRQSALSAVSHSRLWPDKVVVFDYADDVKWAKRRDKIIPAIRHWRRKTNLQFVRRTDETDYILFQNGTGCSAYVGQIGGPQGVFLSDRCSVGNVVHEIGHAVGLHHMQSRADRDDFVTVHPENMIDGVGVNYQIFSQRVVGPYDFGSIMHYGSSYFSKNGRPTMTKLDGSLIVPNRAGLSESDIRSVSMLYGDPVGEIETVTRIDAETVRVKGFAIDPDKQIAIFIELSVDGTVVHHAKARDVRSDLRKLYRRNVRHGFDVEVEAPPNALICLKGINLENGDDAALGCEVAPN